MGWNPVQLQQTDPFGDFGNALLAARKAQKDDDARRAELMFRQQQQTGLDQERQRRAAMEAQDRQAQIRTQITAALDQQRPDMARQIASSYGIQLPERQVQQQAPGDELMKPSAEVQQAPVYGPSPSQEDIARATKTRISLGQDDGDSLEGQLNTAEEGRLGFLQDQQGSRFESQGLMARKPDKTVYNVMGQDYDPTQAREAQMAERQRLAEQSKSAFTPAGQEYGSLVAAMIQAGADPAKAATAVSAAMEKDESRRATEEEKRTNRAFLENEHKLNRQLSEENNRRMAAAIGAGKTQGLGLKERASDRQDESGLDLLTSRVFQQTGFKEVQVQNRKFNDMSAQLATKPNAALDAKTAGTWVKEAQGGTGVISDSDMDVFWNRVGGKPAQVEQWIRDFVDGKMAPDKRAIVMEATKELAKRAQYNLGQIKEAVRYRVKNSAYADRENDVIGTYFPEERNAIEEARRIDAAKNQARANKLKGGGRDALDQDLGL